MERVSAAVVSLVVLLVYQLSNWKLSINGNYENDDLPCMIGFGF